MNEDHRSIPDRGDDRIGHVQRFEAMLHQNDHYFFDVEEFELIIEHYLEENDLRKARQVLTYAKEQHPASVDLLFSEAQVLLSMGKLNASLDVLDRIERFEPYNEDVHLNKAGIYSQLRNHRRAIQHYRKALELAEDGIDDIYLDLAFEHENAEQYEEAIACLKKALEVNPENEAVLYELAYCYDLADAYEASSAFFRSFTNEHPYSFVAWYNLGNALARMERIAESDEALDLCLAIEEEFSSALFSKARNMVATGRFEEAVTCYEEILRIDGAQAVTFSYIGECYEKMERFEQALIHYDQAIALDPNWVDAWIGRGVVKDMQGRRAEAVRDLEQAVRLAPEHGDSWYYLAGALARAERYEEALASYGRVNQLEPENLDAWLDHADVVLELKGPDPAHRKLIEAALVFKLDARYRYRIAELLLRGGHLQDGLLELEEALQMDPKGHAQLVERFAAAAGMPQVTHLIDLHGR